MKNEAENVGPLVEDIETACAAFTHEIILIDDGSTDATAAVIRKLQSSRANLRLIQHPSSGGQSICCAFGRSRRARPCHLHNGWRWAESSVECSQPRNATIGRPPEPWAGCGTTRGSSGHSVEEMGVEIREWFAERVVEGTIRATQDVVSRHFAATPLSKFHISTNMHRYLPAMFKAYGWGHRACGCHPCCSHGWSFRITPNFQRALAGAHDLIGVSWLIKRAKRVRPAPEIHPDTPVQE